MSVRVIRVESIPFGLSALVDEQSDSQIVWLLEADWSGDDARLIEQILNAVHDRREHAGTATAPDPHTV